MFSVNDLSSLRILQTFQSGHHSACYSALTKNSKITRAPVGRQHKNKECEEVDLSSSADEIVDTEQEELQLAKKMLRSSSKLGSKIKKSARIAALMYHLQEKKVLFC